MRQYHRPVGTRRKGHLTSAALTEPPTASKIAVLFLRITTLSVYLADKLR